MHDRAKTEEHLLRTARGDRAAFEALYHATSAKLFGVCLQLLGDAPEAEEALQEVYVRVWHHADRYVANGLSPMTWLITVTRNLCIDRLRAAKRVARPLHEAAEVPDARPDAEGRMLEAAARAEVAACLAQLQTERAQMVHGAYVEGLTYRELARRFDVPLNTIRTWLRRSLISLRECLGVGGAA